MAMVHPQRFIADVHLGKLARHLRMLGFDTLWREGYGDDELLKTAMDENRWLLTRDRELYERAGREKAIRITEQAPPQQLLEVIHALSLGDLVSSRKGFLTLCLDCNHPIIPVKPHHVVDRLPGSVLLQHDEFYLCTRCERVFWKGSHFDKMQEWVEKLLA